MSGALNSFADIPVDILRQSQEDIIQQEEQRQYEYRQNLLYMSPETTLQQFKEQETLNNLERDRAVKNIYLTEIILEGNHVFKKRQLNKFIKRYLNRHVSFDDINHLMRDLTNLYIKKGYVTSRIYIPQQNLASGTLKLNIIESKASELKILENGEVRRGFNTVFPIDKQRVFNIRDYEQGIDQINRLKRYHAKINLEPGDAVGLSKVSVNTNIKKPSKLSSRIESNNGGSHSTGINQQVLHIGLEDFFGLYDSLGFDIRHDMALNGSDRQNRGISTNIVIPHDYWTFRFIADYYKYLQTVRSNLQPYYLTGRNRSFLTELERIIHRDNKSKTGLSLSINRKQSSNYINHVKIEVSSKKLTIGSARFFHTRRILDGVLSLSGEYQRGLKLLGASKDKGKSKDIPKSQFNKLKAYISYYKPFQIKDQHFSWHVSGNGAWSKDTLYASEKISIGGHHTVRGYWDQSLSGNVGGYIRNEIAWQLPVNDKPLTQTIFGYPELYAGFDIGWVRENRAIKNDHGQLKGLGFGIRTRSDQFYGEVGFERAIRTPDSFSKIENRVFLKIGFEF